MGVSVHVYALKNAADVDPPFLNKIFVYIS